MWFFINSLYFPYDAQFTAQQDFDQFFAPIKQALNSVSPIQEEDGHLPEQIESLLEQGNYFRFKDFLSERLEGNSDLSELIDSLTSELTEVVATNDESLRSQWHAFQDKYRVAAEQAGQIEQEGTNLRDPVVYSANRMDEYGTDFLGYVDPYFVKDLNENLAWYLSNQHEILMNVNYPSKQEKKFLRHIELWQQEKNDVNYTQILKQLEDGDQKSLAFDDRLASLSAHKRGLVVQEDAQCAICNNGDYEDEDLIVFCGNCNIPVHQKCYGIDEIPEVDWICNNCLAFNLKRGL